jgi:hypothetical protein
VPTQPIAEATLTFASCSLGGCGVEFRAGQRSCCIPAAEKKYDSISVTVHLGLSSGQSRHGEEAVTQMNVGRGKWSTVGALLLTVGALLSAAPASADPTDDAFLGALSKNGIVMNDGNSAISMARAVCAGFDKNPSSSVMAMKVMKEANLTLKQSGFFVGASISAYCPQWKGKTDDSFDWLNPRPPQM